MLSLTSGQTVDEVIFRLMRAGVITGKVTDDAGKAMIGVSVSVLQKPSEEELEDALPHGKKLELTMASGGPTDDRGEYRMFNLKPGDYYVKATDTAERWGKEGTMDSDNNWWVRQETGSLFAPLYYPGVLQLDQAQAITLAAGDEVQADFAMRRIKTVEVAGKVIGPDGAPATDTYVSLEEAGMRDWGADLNSSVDSSGDFFIKGVPPGSYFISAQIREKDKHYNPRQKIEVGESKIDSITLTQGAGATIRGKIRTTSGAPPPSGQRNVFLQAVNDDENGGFGWTEVNKDGTFEFNGIADGSYTLQTFVEQGWFVKSVIWAMRTYSRKACRSRMERRKGTWKSSSAMTEHCSTERLA